MRLLPAYGGCSRESQGPTCHSEARPQSLHIQSCSCPHASTRNLPPGPGNQEAHFRGAAGEALSRFFSSAPRHSMCRPCGGRGWDGEGRPFLQAGGAACSAEHKLGFRFYLCQLPGKRGKLPSCCVSLGKRLSVSECCISTWEDSPRVEMETG